MKYIYLINILFLMFSSCLNLNKHRFPPEKYFSGELLPIAVTIYNDEPGAVKRYIKKGVDVNSVGEEKGYSLLLYAINVGSKSVVKQLLKLGADPNQMCKTIVENGQEKGTYYITQRYPLSNSAYKGDLSYAKLLLEYGADAKLGYPIHEAIINCPYESKKKMIQLFLDHGADINKPDSSGETPVCNAAIASLFEIVNFLLDRGADPRIINNFGYSVEKQVRKSIERSQNKEEQIKRLQPTIDRLKKWDINILSD